MGHIYIYIYSRSRSNHSNTIVSFVVVMQQRFQLMVRLLDQCAELICHVAMPRL